LIRPRSFFPKTPEKIPPTSAGKPLDRLPSFPRAQCWAHGAISALGDRIKIARKGKGVDINLAVQHVLNCGDAGSCHGGSAAGVYQWLHQISETGSGVVYDTCNPYMVHRMPSTCAEGA
jgi:cathepsin X